MTDETLPLSIRHSLAGAPEFSRSLVEGVPDWLWSEINEFVSANLRGPSEIEHNIDGLRAFEQWRRIPLDWSKGFSTAFASLIQVAWDDEILCLDLIDWLLRSHNAAPLSIAGLHRALERSGSAWAVSFDPPGLIRRLDEAATTLVEDAASPSDRASEHLNRARERAFGRNPDANAAYDEAVKAVEVILRPLVLPNDARATLGRINGTMKANLGSYRTRLSGRDSSAGATAYLQLSELLWQSHQRHGNESEPVAHSTHEAEDAVILASYLVHQIRSGSLSRST